MIAASLKAAEGDKIIDLLLRKGADVNVKSSSGQVRLSDNMLDQYVSKILTPCKNALHFASSKANLSTVRTLLANKCSARVKDIRGQLPLHRAAAVGSAPIIKILLEGGKSPVNATDNDGLTALHHAISEGHGDAAILLLKSGADAEKRDAEGRLAIALVPDDKVSAYSCPDVVCALLTVNLRLHRSSSISCKQQKEKESSFLDFICPCQRTNVSSVY